MYPMYPGNDYYRSPQNFSQPNFPPQQPQIRTYFVTGIEEARAAMIDPLATNIFLDTSSGRIYMKNMGNDGKPQFIVYAIEEQAVPKDPIAEINSRLTNIEKYLGGHNDKSISSNAGIYKSEQVPQPAVAKPYESNETAEPTGLSENARNDQW